MNVEFRRSFEKDLDAIKDNNLSARIKVVEEVEVATDLSEVSNVKKLKTEKAHYRVRIGDYRIGLILNEDAVVFV